MSVALLTTRITAAVAAIDSADYDTAETNLLAANAYLVALPDTEQRDRSIRWAREQIDRLLMRIRALRQPTSVTYTKFNRKAASAE